MTILSPLQFIAEDKESRRRLLAADYPISPPEIVDTTHQAQAPAGTLEPQRVEIAGKAVEIKVDFDQA